jgi:cell volume regulation protein A
VLLVDLRRCPIEFVPEHGWQGNMQEIVIPFESCVIGRAIYELHLPPSYLIVLIHRDGEYLVPNGGMVLQSGDRIPGISAPEVQEQVADMFCQPDLST